MINRWGKRNKIGTTIFAPMKVLPEYYVDRDTQTVTGVVKVDGKTYLSVQVGVKTSVKGSLRRIKQLVHPFGKKQYVEMIQNEALNMLKQ